MLIRYRLFGLFLVSYMSNGRSYLLHNKQILLLVVCNENGVARLKPEPCRKPTRIGVVVYQACFEPVDLFRRTTEVPVGFVPELEWWVGRRV